MPHFPMTCPGRYLSASGAAFALALLLVSPAAGRGPRIAAAGPADGEDLAAAAYRSPEMDVGPSLALFPMGACASSLPSPMASFLRSYPGAWEVRWDERSDRPHLIQGVGVPLLPGRGNGLRPGDVGLAPGAPVSLEQVAALARRFMARFPELFRIDSRELELDPSGSSRMGEDPTSWIVSLRQVHDGVPVRDAAVYFRIRKGNIVQFGADRVADVGIDARPALTADEAFASALENVGVEAAQVEERTDRGTLALVPVLAEGDSPGEVYAGAPGRGYEHRLIWRYGFRRRGDFRTWELEVDAQNGEVLTLVDADDYAQVAGGVYRTTNTEPEIARRFPFANVANNGTKTTNVDGVYNFTGGTATVMLNGKYIRIRDGCGSISLSDSTNGNLSLGTSNGTDCTTPGVGGAGNTHAARTAFYQLTRANRKAAGYLAGNSQAMAWLDSKLNVNTDVNAICNAFWNGSQLSFLRSGAGCSNAGEITSILLHEWAHGLDQNAGAPTSGDAGSSEALGDVIAFLETQDGCIGPNFPPGTNCPNCTACTGVRDVADFSLAGGAGARRSPSPRTSPATPASTATSSAVRRFPIPARWATKVTARPTSPAPRSGTSRRI